MSDWIEWKGESGKPEGLDGEDWVEVEFYNKETLQGWAQSFRWSARRPEDKAIVMYRKLSPVTKPDMVNQPPHYQLLPGVEVYDVRHAILEKLEDVPAGQVDDWSRSWEYLTRMWQKNGLEDAKKAGWYLDKLIEKMEGEE